MQFILIRHGKFDIWLSQPYLWTHTLAAAAAAVATIYISICDCFRIIFHIANSSIALPICLFFANECFVDLSSACCHIYFKSTRRLSLNMPTDSRIMPLWIILITNSLCASLKICFDLHVFLLWRFRSRRIFHFGVIIISIKVWWFIADFDVKSTSKFNFNCCRQTTHAHNHRHTHTYLW